MIPDADLARVLEATDILEVAQRYIRLRRSGKEWFGLCPLHVEKTPSFTVNPSKRAFYCRGCHASGNAIGLIMRLESLPFPKAVRLLAEQAGVEIGQEKRGAEDDYVRAIASEAQWFWHEVRLRYAMRQARAVAYRNIARRHADETNDQERFWLHMGLFRRYGKSAARWDRIISRLDGRSKGDLLTRYIGIRQRHPQVANWYRSARELQGASLAVEKKATEGIPDMPASRFRGLMQTICSHFAR